MSTFSVNLKNARKANGWTQDQASSILQIKRSRLGSYEDGRAHPPLDLFIKITDIYGIRDWRGFINNVNFDFHKQYTQPTTRSLLDQRFEAVDQMTKNLVKQLLSLS